MGRVATASSADTQPCGPFAVDQDRTLAELELAWSEGGYHGFTAAGGTWCAISSAGEVLTGATPDELASAIRRTGRRCADDRDGPARPPRGGQRP
jgi:hypothetical protein